MVNHMKNTNAEEHLRNKKSVLVSILIPVRNEESFIESLIADIKQQSFPHNQMEVIFVDGNSTDRTVELINNSQLSMKYAVLDNKQQYIPHALNIGLAYSRGNIIVRMDAHSSYEQQYVAKLVDKLLHEPVVNVGGPARAKGYDYWSSLIAMAQNSPYGVGGATFRYAQEVVDVDTLFPGAWWKEDLVKANGWNSDWLVNEDTELNLRLRRMTQRKIRIYPDIELYYFPRNSIKKLGSQYFNYGFWRMKTASVYYEGFRPSHVVPVVMIVTLFVGAVLAVLLRSPYFMLPLVVYGLVTLLYSLCKVLSHRETKFKKIVHLSWVFGIMHLSWGLGALKGVIIHGIPKKLKCSV